MNLFPVIHYQNDEQAIRNAALAAKHRCAGVFLIDMAHLQPKETLQCAVNIAQMYPSLKVGVNHLGVTGFSALERNVKNALAMTWTDECVTHTQNVDDKDPGIERLKKALLAAPAHTFFGGVAFKYQPLETNPGRAAQRVLALGGVPTTSGPATGRSASLDKLRQIREAIGPSARLAVASGVTPENVGQLRGLVTDLLVATSITSTDGEELILEERLAAMAELISAEMV